MARDARTTMSVYSRITRWIPMWNVSPQLVAICVTLSVVLCGLVGAVMAEVRREPEVRVVLVPLPVVPQTQGLTCDGVAVWTDGEYVVCSLLNRRVP